MKRILAIMLIMALVVSGSIIALAENAVVLAFHANGGEGTMATVTIENGMIPVPECAMTKPYYRFDGWNTRADGSGMSLMPGETLTVDEVLLLDPSVSTRLEQEGELTLYAQWVHENADDFVKLYITYHANGGQGKTMDSDYYLSGMTALTAFNEFTREGYLFYCWNTKPDNSGTKYNEFEEIPFTDSNIDLYAIWYDPETGTLAPPDDGQSAGNPTGITLGDVNEDGAVSAADALLVLKYVVGKETLTEVQQTAAKTVDSGEISAGNALHILQKVVGKIQRFPIEA